MVEDLSSFKKSLVASSEDAQETPIVTLINKILIKALTTESSEIHIEPQKDQLMVRFCQQGGMGAVFDPFPQGITSAVISRLKVMADLDINQRDICQKGRIQKTFSDRKVEFLVTTLPNRHEEKVILQVLTPLVSKSQPKTPMTSSSTHLAYRLQELERLLKALTYEFEQLKEDLIAQSISTSSDSLIDQEIPNTKDWQARKQDLEADRMTVISDSLIDENIANTRDWAVRKQELEADKMTVTSDSLLYEEMPNERDWAARKQELEADKMTITSDSLLYEEMPNERDWAARKQELEADKMTVISDSLIDENIPNVRDWATRKQELEADKMTITSESSIYEELTDPGDWEQLRRALESDKATIIAESLPEQKLPDPW